MKRFLYAFTKCTAQILITKPQSKSISWYWLHLVDLILNAKNLIQNSSGKVFLGHLGGWLFYNYTEKLPKVALNHGGGSPDTF